MIDVERLEARAVPASLTQYGGTLVYGGDASPHEVLCFRAGQAVAVRLDGQWFQYSGVNAVVCDSYAADTVAVHYLLPSSLANSYDEFYVRAGASVTFDAAAGVSAGHEYLEVFGYGPGAVTANVGAVGAGASFWSLSYAYVGGLNVNATFAGPVAGSLYIQTADYSAGNSYAFTLDAPVTGAVSYYLLSHQANAYAVNLTAQAGSTGVLYGAGYFNGNTAPIALNVFGDWADIDAYVTDGPNVHHTANVEEIS